MKYLRIPDEITLDDVKKNGTSWSAGMHQQLEIPTAETQRIRDVISDYTKGYDPGSIYYLTKSKFYFIRTKALQSESHLINLRGDSIIPINPRVFEDIQLSDGDILLSKDSNVGECAMVDGEKWSNHMLSGGIVRLRPSINRFYLFAFLKHQLFKAELLSLVPRGATIAHANELWMDCHIPFPAQKNAHEVVAYVAAITEAIVKKELAIRDRHKSGLEQLHAEINANQTIDFTFAYPTVRLVSNATRMDAGFWSPQLREQIHKLKHYRRGAWPSIYSAGFTTRRGPNLAVSVSGTGYYSDRPRGNALPMATPGDISDFMTIPTFRFYGNPRKIDTVRHGEIMFAGKGVREVSIGHTWVNLDHTPFVTNFDSFLIHSPDRTRSVFLAFLLSYLKAVGVFAKLSDTSNGGSFVQSHFEALPIPKFEEQFQEQVALNYYSEGNIPARPLTLSNFVNWHDEWNEGLGIWQLDREMKALRQKLVEVQDQIIEGFTVTLPFPS